MIVPAETDSVESDENADDLVEMPTENQRPSSEKGVVDEGTAVIDANDPFVDDELNEAN